ncbi:hypothetical protein Tsubulata_022812 [Turnera subulata]|uniref:Uncharacterized protein n=1 Tax=Turnera subulata TaxID=218843 RepID=A0A9Q0EZU1_9ROSI|nr:hypothetical protein Tsubulata_022812 [Turnera subulata]
MHQLQSSRSQPLNSDEYMSLPFCATTSFQEMGSWDNDGVFYKGKGTLPDLDLMIRLVRCGKKLVLATGAN